MGWYICEKHGEGVGKSACTACLWNEIERLRREKVHFWRVAVWYATHEPGTPSPEWTHLGWGNGTPDCDLEHVEMSEREGEQRKHSA